MIKIDGKKLRFEHTQMKNNALFILVVEMLNHRERERYRKNQANSWTLRASKGIKYKPNPPYHIQNKLFLNTSCVKKEVNNKNVYLRIIEPESYDVHLF